MDLWLHFVVPYFPEVIMTSQHDTHTEDTTCASSLHIWREGEIIWVKGHVYDNRPHTHHALQLVWSEGDAPAELHALGEEHHAQVLLIDSGVTHALHLERGTVALIDPASTLAKTVRAQCIGASSPAGVHKMKRVDSFETPQAWLSSLSDRRVHQLDSRVWDVLRWLDELEAQEKWDEVSLKRALGLVHLSRSRFLHLFSEEVGAPWRTYLVWRRGLVAMTLATQGMSLTEVAHASGYADSAHLSRQIVALFGVVPSALLKHSHFIQS